MKKPALWTTIKGAKPYTPVYQARKPIRKRSKAMTKKMVEYGKVRKEYLANHFYCEVCFRNPATEIHHPFGKIGKLLTETKHFIPCCENCHRRIHSNIHWAQKEGLIAGKGQWLNPPK